jgi:hypothetical protein
MVVIYNFLTHRSIVLVIALIMASVKLVSSATIQAFESAPVVCMVYIMCKELQELVLQMSFLSKN